MSITNVNVSTTRGKRGVRAAVGSGWNISDNTRLCLRESTFSARDFPHVRRRLSSPPNGRNSLLIFPEIRIKLLSQAGYYAEGGSGPRTSGGNISNSHLPGLSPNFILGISKPRDATACTGKTTFRWPPFCTGRKGKLLVVESTSATRAPFFASLFSNIYIPIHALSR